MLMNMTTREVCNAVRATNDNPTTRPRRGCVLMRHSHARSIVLAVLVLGVLLAPRGTPQHVFLPLRKFPVASVF